MPARESISWRSAGRTCWGRTAFLRFCRGPSGGQELAELGAGVQRLDRRSLSRLGSVLCVHDLSVRSQARLCLSVLVVGSPVVGRTHAWVGYRELVTVECGPGLADAAVVPTIAIRFPTLLCAGGLGQSRRPWAGVPHGCAGSTQDISHR
jgi:hypothetical protein